MRGLLMKDLFVLMKTRSLMLVELVFMAMGIFAEGQFGFVAYPFVFVAASLPISLISYDENSKWDVFCSALPVSRAQTVSAKYIIVPIASMATMLLGIVLELIAMAVGCVVVPMGEVLMAMTAACAVSLIVAAVMLPLVFRLGVEKGRIMYYAVIGFTCATTVFLMKAAGDMNSFIDRLPSNLPVLLAVGFAAVVVILMISWRVAIRWYEQREF